MDMASLVKQAQKMQKQLEKKQEELYNTLYYFESNGGAIKIAMYGNKKVDSISIDEDLLSKDEKELLQDMLKVAINEAIASVEDEFNKSVESISGGFSMPGIR